MSEELGLVTELAIILIAAGVFTVISKALKQPLILGYIIAGFIVGPHLGLFPQFSPESVHQWSEIGIIFMLFSLGLEFSFKKLLKIGSSALITALTICVGMFIIGLITGSAMGWTLMESIFLGGLLSMSSTTIILKAYDDMGLKNKPWSPLIFGSLVFEDLIAVLMMVLLSTLAVSNKFAGGEMLGALAKLGFFLILWFLIGIFVIPTLLKKARRYINDEILLIVSIGLCFGMVVFANAVGFSSALGAFVMGSILAETIEGEHIHRVASSLKDLFGAIFFVSVGMMVDPVVIADHWGTILLITIVAVAGILTFATGGALLAGKGLETAVHTGFTMAQLGEFGFIIAGVGCSLGVLRDFIYPVIISVSVITAFSTPYMIKAADPALKFIKKRIPANILLRIDPPQEDLQKRSKAEKSVWKRLLTSYCLRVGLYGVVLVAVLLASRLFLDPIAAKLMSDAGKTVQNICVTVVTLVIMSPFIYGLAVTNGSIRQPAVELMRAKPGNKWPILFLMTFRILVAIAFVMMVILSHFHLAGWALLLIIAAGFALIIAAKMSVRKFEHIENHFMENFNAREEMERKRAPIATSLREKMDGHDVHLEPVTISADCELAGKALRELPIRDRSGVNIVKIQRGSKNILIPSGDETVYPGDLLLAVGTSAQIEAFRALIDECTVQEEQVPSEFTVEAVTLKVDSPLTGKTLHEAHIRSCGCMVISIRKKSGKILTNPRSDTVFEEGDTVWIAGEKDSVDWLI